MEAAKIYFIIFGLLTIAGGIVGYLKAGSTASIIAGAITGVLLLVAAFLLPEHRVAGLATALIISVLLDSPPLRWDKLAVRTPATLSVKVEAAP